MAELAEVKQIFVDSDEFITLLSDTGLPTKRYLDKLHSLHDNDLFNLNTGQINDDLRSNYYSPHSFKLSKDYHLIKPDAFSILHNNVGSLITNLEKFETHLLEALDLYFDIIGISETKVTKDNLPIGKNLNIPGYCFEYVPTPLSAGGVQMYICKNLNYSIIFFNPSPWAYTRFNCDPEIGHHC